MPQELKIYFCALKSFSSFLKILTGIQTFLCEVAGPNIFVPEPDLALTKSLLPSFKWRGCEFRGKTSIFYFKNILSNLFKVYNNLKSV